MSYTILHCADVHLEASFASSGLSGPVSSWRRLDLRATLGRILTLARERRVDAVTIAGDLYEQAYALPESADFLVQQFARLAPIPVYVAPGEQDPYTNDSLYALTRWPDNVRIFNQGSLTAVQLAPDIYLWGAACPASRRCNTLEAFHVDREGVNLLLLHAKDTQQPASGDETLFTVNASHVRQAGFDFALLGHHHRSRLWPQGSPCCAYPGSPEPMAWEEAADAHQVVLLTIEEGICAPEMILTSQWRYRSWHVDLTGCESITEASARVDKAIRSVAGDNDERTVGQVTLTGQPCFDFSLSSLQEQVTTEAHLTYKIQLAPPYELERLAQEQTVRGLLVQRFLARLENAGSSQKRAQLQSALLCALGVLGGKQVNLDEVR